MKVYQWYKYKNESSTFYDMVIKELSKITPSTKVVAFKKGLFDKQIPVYREVWECGWIHNNMVVFLYDKSFEDEFTKKCEELESVDELNVYDRK